MTKNSWDIELIGALASNEFVQEKAGKSTSVFKNSQNSIQFLIKVVSDTPEYFPNIRLFNCYTSDLIKFGYEDDIRLSESDRIRILREYLNDRLIIFKPNKKVLQDRSTVYRAKDVKIVKRTDSYKDLQTFKPIPIFSQKVHEFNYDNFVEKLIERRHVGRIDNISHEPDDTPEIILWKQNDGQFSVIGNVSGHSYAQGGFNFNFKDKIKEVKFEEIWLEDAYSSSDTLLFIGMDTFTQILGHLEVAAPAIHYGNDDIQEKIDLIDEEKMVQLMDEPEDVYSKEIEFLERLLFVTREQELLYDKTDLYNFHTAMKSSTLVILAGMSGTGKSRLVQAYLRALKTDPTQLTIIPVRPAWSDDADIIGYVDSIHMVYRPGDSGLVNTLIDAQNPNNTNNLYIICFDEMNLARVEHYFSQFLSVLEMEPTRRNLRLYNEELEQRLYNSAQYPSSISIGENVMFIGTVNLDESTYHFSDKVLDRANIIKLNVRPFDELIKFRELNGELTDEKKKRLGEDFKEITNEDFQKFKSKDSLITLTDEERSLLWEIHQDFQIVNRNLGIGPRIIKQIDTYLKNLPNDNFLSRSDAFDLQLVQRVLTKLRGPEDFFKSLIGTMNLETGKIEDSKLLDRFIKFKTVSSFSESIKVIEQKAKELKYNGYTL